MLSALDVRFMIWTNKWTLLHAMHGCDLWSKLFPVIGHSVEPCSSGSMAQAPPTMFADTLNTLRSRQDGWHFRDVISKCILLLERFLVLIKISLKFVADSLIDDNSSLSHPGLGWLYIFSSFPWPPRPQKLIPLTSKPFELNLWYLAQRIYGSGKMYWMTWPWPKVTAVASISKNLLVCAIKWEPPRITTKRGSCVTLVMVITWLDFGEVLFKTVILANFL